MKKNKIPKTKKTNKINKTKIIIFQTIFLGIMSLALVVGVFLVFKRDGSNAPLKPTGPLTIHDEGPDEANPEPNLEGTN